MNQFEANEPIQLESFSVNDLNSLSPTQFNEYLEQADRPELYMMMRQIVRHNQRVLSENAELQQRIDGAMKVLRGEAEIKPINQTPTMPDLPPFIRRNVRLSSVPSVLAGDR